MKYRTNQSGFSVVELAIVVVIVAVLGFIGYTVYNRQNNKTASTTTVTTASTNPAKANDVASAPNINSTSDLDKAQATLDQTNPSGSNNTDATQLDAQLANF